MIEPGPYVRLRNFERLIHYGKRPPTWCKLYSELLRDDDFLALTFTERGILVGIWQVEASNRRTGRGKRPISRQSLTRNLGQRVSTRQLERLNHAGFVELLASREVDEINV